MEFRVKNGKKNKKNASRFAACAAAVMMIGAGTIAGDSWRTAGTAYAASRRLFAMVEGFAKGTDV